MVNYTNIKYSQELSVSTIRMDHPETLNALSPLLVSDLRAALDAVAEDESSKAVVLRGEGRAFCAGADLSHFQEAFKDPAHLREYLGQINGLLFQLEDLPIPVIAVVHGYALAGGLELMMACDMVLTAEDARIGDQHVNVGLIPGGGSTQRLPRRVGMQRAMELLTSGRWLTGAEAVEWGLALRAVPQDQLDGELEKLLAPLRTKSRPGLGWIKSLANRGRDLPVRDGVALETEAFNQYVATSSHSAEGVRAFMEKRAIEF